MIVQLNKVFIYLVYATVFMWTGTFKLSGQISNNTIDNAVEIFCGETIQFSFDNALAAEISPCSRASRALEAVWFEFKGLDRFVEIDLLGELDMELSILYPNGMCAEYLSLLEIKSATFFAARGVLYKLRAAIDPESNSKHGEIKIRCFEENSGISCLDPEIIDLELEKYYYSTFPEMEYFPIKYFEFTGLEGNHFVHYFAEDGHQAFIGIAYADCGEDLFVGQSLNSGATTYPFYFDKSCRYSLKIGRYPSDSDSLFSFRFSKSNIALNDNCENAELIQCGDIINYDSYKASTIYGELCNNFMAPTLWYKIKGQNRPIKFSLISGDRITATIFEESCDPSNCIYYEIASASSWAPNFFAEDNKEYLIALNVGDFLRQQILVSLHVECFDFVENNTCATATELDFETTVYGSTIDALKYVDDCLYNNAPSVWYTFISDGKSIEFENIGDRDLVINIYSGLCDALICNKTFFIPVKKNRRTIIHSLENKRYWIQCSFDGYNIVGDFAFKVTRLSAFSPNNICSRAKEINCLDSIIKEEVSTGEKTSHLERFAFWYKIVGDGNIYQLRNTISIFNITVFEGNECQLTYLTRKHIEGDRYVEFLTEIGKNYYIFIEETLYIDSLFVIIDCIQPSANVDCDAARLIECGDVISENFRYTAGIGQSEYCIPIRTQGFWYKIEGNDRHYVFEMKLTHSSHNGNVIITVHDNDCEESYDNCLLGGRINPYQQMSFFAEANTTYLVRMAYDEQYERDFDFLIELNCYEDIVNDECNNAIIIQAGDTISGNTLIANYDESIGNPENECMWINSAGHGVWYQYIGDDQIVSLSILGENNNFRFNVFKGECNDLLCVLRTDRHNRQTKFFAEKGLSYYISVLSDYTLFGNEFDIAVTAAPRSSNDQCMNALLIESDNSFEVSFSGALSDGPVCVIYGGIESLWYKIVGKNQRVIIHPVTSSVSEVNVYVLKGDCIDYNCGIGGLTVLNNENNQQFYDLSFDALCSENYLLFIETDDRFADTGSFLFEISFTDLLDEIKPEIQCPDDIEILFNKEISIEFGLPVINDNAGSPTLTFFDKISYGLGHNRVIDRFWSVVDCGNNSNSCVQTIKILDTPQIDIVGPTNVCPASFVEYSSSEIENAEGFIWHYSEAGVILQSFTDSIILINFSNEINSAILDLQVFNGSDTIHSRIDIRIVSPEVCELTNCSYESIFVSEFLLQQDLLPSIISASKSIISQGTIGSESNYIFKAGEFIEFKPGFTIQDRAIFNAIIEACDNPILELLNNEIIRIKK